MGVSFYVIKVEKAFIAIIKKKHSVILSTEIYTVVSALLRHLEKNNFFLTKACQIQ